MVVDRGPALVRALRSIDEDALRSVGTYDEATHEFLFLRDDLADRADASADGHEALVLDGECKERLEQQFDASFLQHSYYEFERFHAYHFAVDRCRGLFVSFDADAVIEAEAVRAVVDDHIEDR